MTRNHAQNRQASALLQSLESRQLLTASPPLLTYTDILFDPLPAITAHQPFTITAHVVAEKGPRTPTGSLKLIAIAFQDLLNDDPKAPMTPIVLQLGEFDLENGTATINVNADLTDSKRWVINATYSGDDEDYFTALMVGPLHFTTTPSASAPAEPVVVSAPSPPPNPNEALVTRLYHDLLGRMPETQGLAQWTSMLDAGSITPEQVASFIAHSPEYYSRLIRNLYQDILNRPADDAGLQGWIAAFKAGATLEQVQAQFYASEEYVRSHGVSTSALVNDYYQAFLQRTADPAGLAYFTNLLNQGSNPGEAVASLRDDAGAEASRNAQSIVTQAYQTYLHRAPETTGLNTWTTQLLSGTTSQLDLTLSLVTSAEYLQQS